MQAHDVDNLGPIKERVGVPAGKGSCHTAEVGGYFLEGHVPGRTTSNGCLKEKPAAKGLTVPGMPLGSPGMEVAVRPGRSLRGAARPQGWVDERLLRSTGA